MDKLLNAIALSAIGLCAMLGNTAKADVLSPGQTLYAGQQLAGHNGQYFGAMQLDGNFVVYRTSGGVVWSSNTTGLGGDRLMMQTDGNLVMYTPAGRAVWHTNTANVDIPGNRLTIDDLGRAVIYTYLSGWASGTGSIGNADTEALVFQAGFNFPAGQVFHQANGYDLVFQTDGNFVLYRNGPPIWAANVTGNKYGKATSAAFNTTHGLIGTWNDRGEVWQIPSPRASEMASEKGDKGPIRLGSDGSLLVLQSDGNLVYYSYVRKWGAPDADPPPQTVPPGKEPHCTL